MRFCLVSTQEHWGGGESLLASIGNELVLAGHAVGWIVRQDGEIESRVIGSGADVLHATQARGWNPADWLAIRRRLRDWVADVVVLNDSHAVPLVGSVVWSCRRPRPLRLAYKHTVFRLHSPLKYRLLCDKLVCVSQAAMETVLQGGLSPGLAEVVQGGCTPIDNDPSARASVRQELALQVDQPLLVCVGSLLECKGHRELLEAITLLRPTHPKLVAVIAGEGEERPRLQQQIQQAGLEGQVRLLGYRHDAERLLDAADLVVHPSHAEGLSLVLIQAQMLGKAIVATAAGGASEVLAAGLPECSSWIALPKNPRSVAEGISAALAATANISPELKQRLEATAQRMRSKFTVRASAAELTALAARLLGH